MKKSIKSLFEHNIAQARYKKPVDLIGQSVILFLQGDITQMIKIVHCRNWQNHLAGTKKECSETVEMISKVPGDLQLKIQLFDEFVHLRAHDDWFHSSPELINLIKTLEQ
jgi:hypothetical protein